MASSGSAHTPIASAAAMSRQEFDHVKIRASEDQSHAGVWRAEPTIVSNASGEGCSRIVAIGCPKPWWVAPILFFSTPAFNTGILDTIHLVQGQNTGAKHLDAITLISPVFEMQMQ